MSYIYHLRPNPFVGTKLIALNAMDRKSELYKGHAKKYIGREHLMDEVIPTLDCKWNDVVQFSALDPQIIVNELKNYQDDLKIVRLHYFKIHINEIIPHFDAVIFDRSVSREKENFEIDDSEVQPLKEETYIELKEVPEETISYWKRMKEKGGRFLWFPFITHVLVKGTIETSNFELCELKL